MEAAQQETIQKVAQSRMLYSPEEEEEEEEEVKNEEKGSYKKCSYKDHQCKYLFFALFFVLSILMIVLAVKFFLHLFQS